MVTKYDVFLYLADKGTAIKTPEVMKNFKRIKHEYQNIYHILSGLVKEDLATRSGKGFQVKLSLKSRLLHRLITYCINNGINYNHLIDVNLADFVAKALLKTEFTLKDFKINPKTFKKYTEILKRYGLIIIISTKPFKARITWNHLLSNILQYFDMPVFVRKENKIDFLDRIEKELKIFNRKIKQNETAYNALTEDFETRFIHSNLSIEGNPVTLPNTIKILKDKIMPKDLRDSDIKEIQNYQIALRAMMKDSRSGNALNKGKILNYHFLAMQHNEEIAGKLRKISVRIKGNPNFKVAPVDKIGFCFDQLMKRYDIFTAKRHTIKEIIDFASYFHNQFQYIHPFADGNSRVARLITFHLLQYFKIPILDIPLGILDQYLTNTKSYIKRDDRDLSKTLQLIILYNLKIINDKL